MISYVISGGKPLYGEVEISGAKNAAVAILPSTLMSSGVCCIENIPKVNDVTVMLEIMQEVGAKINLVGEKTVLIDPSGVRAGMVASYELVRRIRSSYYLIGAMLSRFSHARVAMPGGDDFGVRPIDQHIKGFEALGAETSVSAGFIHADIHSGKLTGAPIYLDVASVGATVNIMLAACMADGVTHIENSAREPHVVDLANFLNLMGADVKGAGTDLIKIRGCNKLNGGTYAIIPDQIEAGTYMTAVASAGGEVLIKNVIPKHLECITAKLIEMGAEVIEYDDSVLVKQKGRLKKTNVKTLPYPGFPTDMQPQISACLCKAEGTSMITESVWDNRYRYVEELGRMGARVSVDGKLAVIEGVERLTGAPVQACDLRAGAALIVAALGAHGKTEIGGVYHIERGYEDIVSKLQNVGADIKRIELPDPDTIASVV